MSHQDFELSRMDEQVIRAYSQAELYRLTRDERIIVAVDMRRLEKQFLERSKVIVDSFLCQFH
ncbi:hypothetical protein N9R79_03515 [Vibrio sp.]|nr:hypothetical protein [Vibrio sp.]